MDYLLIHILQKVNWSRELSRIKEYKKIWDDIYKMVLISSASFIAVLGNVIHAFIPVNLILLFIFINVGVVLLRKYYASLL